MLLQEEEAVSELRKLMVNPRVNPLNTRKIVEMNGRGVTARRLSEALDGLEAIDTGDTVIFLADNPAFHRMSSTEATALLHSLRRHPSVQILFDHHADAKCVEACIPDRSDPILQQLLFSSLVCKDENEAPAHQ